MKLNKLYKGVTCLLLGTAMFTACTDKVAFGDSFLDKAAGNTVTEDTVFNSAEYTGHFSIMDYHIIIIVVILLVHGLVNLIRLPIVG